MSLGALNDLRPGIILKSKSNRKVRAAKNKFEYYDYSQYNKILYIPVNSLITVLGIDESCETGFGLLCKFWFLYENKKLYTEIYQNNFYDYLEKII